MPAPPYNLPEHTVQLTLQYLLPPVPPLPPHLLSNPLRQRHLLLHTSDGSYFCWPSSCASPDRLLSLLESLSSSDLPPSRISKPAYALPDEHTLLACVDIGGLVRLVWRWECDRHEWGYHDAMLLPAPIGTPVFPHADVKEALYSLPRNTFLERFGDASPTAPTDPLEDGTIRPGRDAPAAADYWAGYGSRSPSPEAMRGAGGSDDEGGDDAYWASYGQVGGTADSTVPSPVNPERLLARQVGGAESEGERKSDVHLLAPETTRKRPREGEQASERTVGGERGAERGGEPKRSEISLNSVPPSPVRSFPLQPSAAAAASSSSMRYPRPDGPPGSYLSSGYPGPPEDGEDKALEDALRGLWRMYVGKGREGPGIRACEHERERFLAAARRAAGDRRGSPSWRAYGQSAGVRLRSGAEKHLRGVAGPYLPAPRRCC
ncbi:hypothetical protein CALCODRAFT_555359 [Calocera cornea HHB12733]|uniref:Uncharacterized protein n=1 Tax=Calocera cornea HHB12733 TaxID=1353952 RepID=A0A165FZ04_9BASI|nr:hypothetical protein CALCODRAFT_555359 [Calocera cornea HHB12733]